MLPLQIVLAQPPPVSSLTVLGTDLMAALSCRCGSLVLSFNLQGTMQSFLLSLITALARAAHASLALPTLAPPDVRPASPPD